MSAIRNLPTSHKFTYAFGIVCGLCIALGGYTCLTFRAIAQKNLDVSSNSLPALIALADARGAANNVRRQDLDLLLCTAPACFTQHASERKQGFSAYEAAMKVYEPTISYPGERELWQKISGAFAQYTDTSNRASALMAAGKAGDALDLLMSDTTVGQFNTLIKGMNEDFVLNCARLMFG